MLKIADSTYSETRTGYLGKARRRVLEIAVQVIGRRPKAMPWRTPQRRAPYRAMRPGGRTRGL